MTRKLRFAAYPTLGEGLRFFAAAFDLRTRTDEGAAKRLDRAAREGDFDWQLFPELVNEVIRQPMRQQGDLEFGEFMVEFAHFLRDEYVRLLGRISVDALTRQQLMPLLIAHFFGIHVARFLRLAEVRFVQPPPELLLSPPLGLRDTRTRSSAIRSVLEAFLWAQGHSANDIPSAFHDGKSDPDREIRDLAANWLAGKQLPDMPKLLQFVLTAEQRAWFKTGDTYPTSRDLRRGLRIARALDYCEVRSPRRVDFRKIVLDHLMADNPVDIGMILSIAVIEQGARYGRLSEIGLRTHHALAFDESRNRGDIERAAALLVDFEEEAKRATAPWAADWMIVWCRARLAIWRENWQEGLDAYESAVRDALYRAGPQMKRLLHEAITVSALLRKRPAFKRFMHQAIALDLGPPILGRATIEAEEIESAAHVLKMRYLPEAPLP